MKSADFIGWPFYVAVALGVLTWGLWLVPQLVNR